MPWKIDRLKLKLPREHKGTVKYTEEDWKEVRRLYDKGTSLHAIARLTGISRKAIQYFIYPERLVIAKEQYKIRRLDGRYYNKEKHRIAIKNTRKKRTLLKDQLI